MNKNKMLNDKPIFVAKIRIFRGLILAAIGLMFTLVICSVAQESEANKLVQVALWVFGGLCGMGGVFYLYITLIFKKIMLFDDRIEVHCLNKVIVRTYSQIKSCCISRSRWYSKSLKLECEPEFMHSYLDNTFLHKNDLHKIEEILIKKGVKDKG
ncbi:MAG: hypothetical protein SO144_05540 [Campylobacter sp.]|nr:hypothetical protein [Campylobacter sp.]